MLLAAMLATAEGRAASALPTPRVLSLSLCIDTVLVELAPREQIVALSHYAREPERSTIVELAHTFPVTYETAEEVVTLRPDLVLASRHSAFATRNALRRVGIPFELFNEPDSIAESIDQIRRIAKLIGRVAAGEALIARIERAVTAARLPAGRAPLSAAIYQPGGLTAGPDTLPGELMRTVGLINIAERYDIKRWRPLPLELLVASPPNVLLVGEVSPGAPTASEQVIQHRALRALDSQMNREPFAARLLYCAGPVMIDALRALVSARENAVKAGL